VSVVSESFSCSVSGGKEREEEAGGEGEEEEEDEEDEQEEEAEEEEEGEEEEEEEERAEEVEEEGGEEEEEEEEGEKMGEEEGEEAQAEKEEEEGEGTEEGAEEEGEQFMLSKVELMVPGLKVLFDLVKRENVFCIVFLCFLLLCLLGERFPFTEVSKVVGEVDGSPRAVWLAGSGNADTRESTSDIVSISTVSTMEGKVEVAVLCAALSRLFCRGGWGGNAADSSVTAFW
jgi:hypothetical protein